MWVAGSGFSACDGAADAARQAAEEARTRLGSHTLTAGLLFASGHAANEIPLLLRAAREVLGTERFVGGTASGVLSGGRDADGKPGVAVLAFAGVDAEPFLLGELRGRERTTGVAIASYAGGPLRSSDLVVLISDPLALSPRALLSGLREGIDGATVVGAGAAAACPGAAHQWLGTQAVTGALAGLVLRCDGKVRVGVTQACRPVGGLFTVTRTAGLWLEALDGRPALDVYREVARAPLASDLRRAASFLMVALPSAGEESLARGHYRARHLVGFSEEKRSFALPEPLSRGQEIAFVLRDREGAREGMRDMLQQLDPEGARAALYLSCSGRGKSLFGVEGLEAGYLDRALGDLPLVGMQGSAQLAPLVVRPEILTYTGVLALLGGG